MFLRSVLMLSMMSGPAVGADQTPPIQQKIKAGCRAVQQLERSKLPRLPELGSVTFHQEARNGRFLPESGSAISIKAEISYSGAGLTPTDTIWAWRGDDGAWMVSRASEQEMSGPHLPWPLDPELKEQEWAPPSRWTLQEGALGPEGTHALELLLGSGCLDAEPSFRPLNVPLRGGKELKCSWHPTSTLMEIRKVPNSRVLLRSCNRYFGGGGSESAGWISDSIIELLKSADLRQLNSTHRKTTLTELPEEFQGKWSQDLTLCGNGQEIALISASAFSSGELQNEVASVERISPNSLRIKAVGPGIIENGPKQEFEQLMLLSPDRKRLALLFYKSPILYERCA